MESKRRGNSLQTRNSTPDGVPFSRPRTRNEPSTFQCGWQEQSKSLSICQEHHPVLNQKRTKTPLIFVECWAMKFVIRTLVFHIWASVLHHKWRPDMYFNHHGHIESSIWAKTNLLHLTPHQSLLLPLWWCVFFLWRIFDMLTQNPTFLPGNKSQQSLFFTFCDVKNFPFSDLATFLDDFL